MDQLWPALSLQIPKILNGALITIVGALISMVLAMVFAIPAGLGRLSRVPAIRSVSTLYVEVIRGTPLLLQLFIWIYGVRIVLLTLFNFNIDSQVYNLLSAMNSNNLFPSTGVSALFFAVVGLSFNYGAYLAEVIRAGVLAVDSGQNEASLSLGLSQFQTTRYIVLPQALRIMIPPITNNFITLVQDTAFWQVLAVPELSLATQSIAQETNSNLIRWEFFTVELVIYFVICYSLALVSRELETRNTSGTRTRRPLLGLGSLAPMQRAH
jgi:His/Glu/Gln/Arg/opine family amino acid ABC transporter permease subunit